MDKRVTLRDFQDEDRTLMVHWLRQEHVQQWLLHPENWLLEIDHRCDQFKWLHHYIVMLNGEAIGFCQYYDCFLAKELEEWLDVEEEGKTYSLDYLIGNANYLGKGYGKQIVQQLVEKIQQQESTAQEIIVEPDQENFPSQKVLLANEFHYISEKGYYQKRL